MHGNELILMNLQVGSKGNIQILAAHTPALRAAAADREVEMRAGALVWLHLSCALAFPAAVPDAGLPTICGDQNQPPTARYPGSDWTDAEARIARCSAVKKGLRVRHRHPTAVSLATCG